MHTELIFAAMLAIATVVAVISRRLNVPFTVALVLVGLALGVAKPFEPPHLTKELLYGVFLPGLLFEASYHVPWAKFRRDALAIITLAVPGMIVAVALTALLLLATIDGLAIEPGFLLVHALVFGSLIAATDPIAVTALFKSMGAPKRLLVLIEGESLINDGAAVVVFALAVELALGGSVSPGYAIGEFALIAGMGIVIGALVGFAASLATRHIDEPLVEITLTTIAAYGSFALAEQFGFSGVIATVVAGIICGNYGASIGMSPTTRLAVEAFWEYVAFVFNSFVFLLIGLEVPLDELARSWSSILLAYGAVVLARGLVVAAVTIALGRTRGRVPWSWALVLTWGGLRGALSMVLVLGLAATFPHRSFLVTITFGVVVLSILIQGLTMTPLLRRLGLVARRTPHAAYEAAQAELRAARAALESLVHEAPSQTELLERFRAEYTARAEAAELTLSSLKAQAEVDSADAAHALSRRLLMTEKLAVQRAARAGHIDDDAAARATARIDTRLRAHDVTHDPDDRGPDGGGNDT